MIDLNSLSLKSKKTRSSTGIYDVTHFKSYIAYQAYLNNFMGAPVLIERVVEQGSLLDINISKWFVTKD